MLARAGLGNWLSLEAAHDADYVEVSGLPPGLMVDAVSGVISGVPGIVGDYSVNVTASNRFGIANGTLLIRVASLVPWGNNAGGQTNVPAELTNVVAIATGGELSLALLWQPTVPTPWLELSRDVSGLALQAHGVPGISCQLLRASRLTGPWLPTQPVTFTNAVHQLRPPDTSEPAQFYRLLRK